MRKGLLASANVKGRPAHDTRHEHFASFVQVRPAAARHEAIMNGLVPSVYALSVVTLFLKFFATISVQALERLNKRHFRYPEDAAFWRGKIGEDSERCVRAQHLLRNDAESQIWYLGLAGAYTLLGAWPNGAPIYFGTYVVARSVHGYFLLVPKQPHRNRAFSLGMLVLFVLAGHVSYEAIMRWTSN